MEQDTRANGKTIINTARVFKFGQMEPNMKDFGKITRLMEKELFGMFMATNMKVIGSEIRLTGTESTRIVTEQPTRETGGMIFSTVKV